MREALFLFGLMAVAWALAAGFFALSLESSITHSAARIEAAAHGKVNP